ncbi:MAG: SxtJ family membrane protein [Endomicrobiaceae bacterium]
MNKEQELKVMAALSLACLILFFIFKIKLFAVICLLFLILALFGGRLSFIVAKAWMSFAHVLGKINTKILIGIAYYLCLTPIAFIFRLFNKKDIADFFNKKDTTYFKDTGKKYTKKDLEQLW